MKNFIPPIEQSVRKVMKRVAIGANKLSGGTLTPNTVTMFGFLMHIPIAYLIATGSFIWAGILLIIFGLFDTLDGELARLQKRVSDLGGFLDATTDRIKEVLLYIGAAYFIASGSHPRNAVWAVAACGASLCVSYVKAKGEAVTAASKQNIPYPVLNKLFASGLFSFQIRMTVLVVGLLADYLLQAVVIIAVISALTAAQRLILISRSIK